MKPEDHIDKNYIPSEDDFAPEQVNEKEQLLKSISKGCRFYTVFYSILAIVFAIEGIIKFDDVSDSKLYLCPLIALMLVFALVMVLYAFIYDLIRRSSTAKEMQHFLKLLGANSLFSKLILLTSTLCFMMAAVLWLLDKCPWYLIILAAIAIAALIGGLWWLLIYSGKGNPDDSDIERLRVLEEKEQQAMQAMKE